MRHGHVEYLGLGTDQPVRLGILGTRRGLAFAEAAALLEGVEVAAFCGRNERRMEIIEDLYPQARLYASYDEMLADDDVNAVVVANYADQHAPAACAALRAGKHVLSEVPACVTVAEGVELARTVESSRRVYMLAENFCYLAFVQEMRRLFQAGVLGDLRYAEGEYMHYASDVLHMLVDLDVPHHWRTWVYPTFYSTHSVGPILWVTGLRPLAVQGATGLLNNPNGLPIQTPAVETVRLENGALARSLHGGAYPREPWQPWYLIGGSRGCIENSRWPDPNQVVHYDHETHRTKAYLAEFPKLREEAGKTQHWGADLFVTEAFVRAVRTGSRPEIDVYMGLDMTLCGNLAWRSVLDGGRWIEVPDLRIEAVRSKWENDHFSCRPGTPAEYALPNHVASDGTVLPSKEVLERLRARQAVEPYYKAMYRD